MIQRILKGVLRVCARSEGLGTWMWGRLQQSEGYLIAKATERAASLIEDRVSVPNGATVQRGPFTGMVVPFTDVTSIRKIAPYVLGSYERELHNVIDRQLRQPYKQIINVGAGWGYYCVGMAKSRPGIAIYAFEADEQRRAICRRVAKLNGVWDRLLLHGSCNFEELKGVLSEGKRGLLLIDCEGCEQQLLPAHEVSLFRKWDLLVEIHDEAASGVSTGQILCDRFQNSHAITWINLQHRNPARYPELAELSEVYANLLLDEGRVHSRGWLWLCSRA